jgi:hypothetical protein
MMVMTSSFPLGGSRPMDRPSSGGALEPSCPLVDAPKPPSPRLGAVNGGFAPPLYPPQPPSLFRELGWTGSGFVAELVVDCVVNWLVVRAVGGTLEPFDCGSALV